MYGKVSVLAMLTLAVLLSSTGYAWATETVYVTGGSVRGRALAMGGAYSSLEDDFSSGLYNPAAFRLNAARSERKFRVFFNPAGSAVAFREFSRNDIDFQPDNCITEKEAFRAASLFLKGVVFTTPVADFGLSLNEPVLRSDSSLVHADRFLSAESVIRESFHSVFLNLRIAPTISMGVSGALYQTRTEHEDKYRSGHTFGVLLEPTPKMLVGLAYTNIPSDISDARVNVERIEGGTVSGGVSFYPDSGTTLSVDVRNLNQEESKASLEIHAGAERIIGNRLALRAGYYRKKETKDDVVSVGAGILPLWGKVAKFRNSIRTDLLSYTYIWEEGLPDRQWHLLSLLVKF